MLFQLRSEILVLIQNLYDLRLQVLHIKNTLWLKYTNCKLDQIYRNVVLTGKTVTCCSTDGLFLIWIISLNVANYVCLNNSIIVHD
jgi:hypothetical protein